MGTTTVNSVVYVNSSGAVSFADIRAAFSNFSNSLAAYRSKKWYASDFTRGNLSATSLSFSSFRGKGGNIPRVNRTTWPSTGNYFSSGSSITLPAGFNTVQFVVFGAGGGGGGYSGTSVGGPTPGVPYNNGGAGSAGGTTSITAGGTTYSATGGAGGNNGSDGANGSPDPGSAADYIAGGGGNGTGGKGGRLVTSAINADTNWAAASALFSAACSTTFGAGGAGGGGGGNLLWNGNNYATPYGTAANGSPGGSGGITVFVDYGLY